MSTLRIGIMGSSAFAKRAMIPAFQKHGATTVTAVASRTAARAKEYAGEFGCDGVEGYAALLKREDVDAVYMPLPTGLHEEWVTRALEAGKPLLVEKSFAMNLESATRMVDLARAKKLLVMENFLFPHHSQFAWIRDHVDKGELGDVRLLRSTFGFPPLPKPNFRYEKALGGGALLDTGGYVVRAARLFLGEELELLASTLHTPGDEEVDIYGDAMFINAAGQVAQISFGFNYHYQCSLELLGTKGKLTADRIFTAPPRFGPPVRIEHGREKEEKTLQPDDPYANMAAHFSGEILEKRDPAPHADSIVAQARLLEAVAKGARRS